MKKTITMNDVISFINTAMQKELIMEGYVDIPQITVLENEAAILFRLQKKGLYIINRRYNSVCIEDLSEKEVAEFKLMITKVKEYSQNKLRNYFWNFFDDKDEKSFTIDDLDNEDD